MRQFGRRPLEAVSGKIINLASFHIRADYFETSRDGRLRNRGNWSQVAKLCDESIALEAKTWIAAEVEPIRGFVRGKTG